nr:MAK10-like protein [Tanacetum cinerariifolium]
MGDENPIRTLGDYSRPSHEGYWNTIKLPKRNNMVLFDRTPSCWTAKLHNDILMFQKHHGESLSEAWTRFKDLLQKVPHHGIDLWLQVQIFMTMSIPSQDEPLSNRPRCGPHDTQYCIENHEQIFVEYSSSHTDEAEDARLSKFKADFKQQQSEMTNKIDTVLKAITDRIAGTLPSDTVKNPKLRIYPVSSTRSYPTMDPQRLTFKENEEEERDNPESHSNSSTPPDPSISFLTEKVLKFNSLFESLRLVPPSPNTELVCTKEEDSDVMFIEIIPKDEDSHKDKPKVEGATTEEPRVDYFDTFPTRDELTYHRYLMSGPILSIFLRYPIITEGFPHNLKILCNIGHMHIEKAYIDLNFPLNIMTRMMYNWIMRRKLNPREDANGGFSNFMGRVKGMHVFVGNFTYVIDFMIVEDISSILDPRLSQVVLGRPFIEIFNMTHDPPEESRRSIFGAAAGEASATIVYSKFDFELVLL